ncbi:hypothetical protein GRF59_15205 [Paenibacillus sp. HJL G12]|uniref:Uncharacterized protein n=1 Tax=Paenibacillus dendrobii TaxID=2691084 RepID=A0A7X3IJ70_9BACL|nr:hypothetical protein [Paenibacillus dendrobii]MWV44969.1 hypothetical protein [Paenibacillus dendrobii]
MSRLENLSKDKETIMLRLIDSPDLCKALYYRNSDFLDQSDIEDTSELLYKNIYPFSTVPELSKDRMSYVTMALRNYGYINNVFRRGYVYFYVIIHKDLLRTEYGFLRNDFILNEIDRLMNEKRGIGIGKTRFYKMDEMYVNDSYTGYYTSYKLVD